MANVREIVPTDLPELFQIRAATDENPLSIAELAELGITIPSVEGMLRMHHRGWLYEEAGVPLGFAIGDRSTGEVWVIAVLPQHVQRGIGSRLLEKVSAWLFSESCTELWLVTDLDPSMRAYRFYLKHGWEDWKEEDGQRYMRKKRK